MKERDFNVSLQLHAKSHCKIAKNRSKINAMPELAKHISSGFDAALYGLRNDVLMMSSLVQTGYFKQHLRDY